MLCKYVLIINGVTHELSKSCIRNWDEIQCTLKRNDFEGVTRTFTSKFEFTREAYDLLLDEWVDKYLLSDASIEIYEINNQHTYDLLISVKLDFGTFDNDGCIISMSSVDGSTAKIIKANKSTQYEYLVRDIKDRTQLYYDRLSISNMAKWIITGDIVEREGRTYVENTFSGSGRQAIYTIPIYVNGEQEIAVKQIIEIYDVGKRGVSFEDYEGKYFLKNVSTSNLSVNIKIRFDIYAEIQGNGTSNIRLESIPSNGSVLFYQPLVNGKNEISFDGNFVMSPNMIVFLGVMTATGYTKLYQEMTNDSKDALEMSFLGKQEPIYIDVVRPDVLLDNILKSMNEGLTGIIDFDDNPSLIKCAILAAESIRGIPNAKIYTSYTKFTEWMEAVFGYVPIIENKTVRFIHRDKLFTSKIAKGIGGNHTEFSYSVNEKMIYSSVCVGYEKQDYDSINGRDEFRFTTEFTTGINITDNKLELISPYRADAYGFEFLAQKRGQNTTDNESDNDIFFVGAESKFHYEYVGGFQILVLEDWKLIRGGNWSISGVLSPDTMFNVMYNQRAMLHANEKYIGISADKLNFASSDGNSDVVINSVKLSDPFIIQNRLATCAKISFSTFEEKLPSSMDGIVTLEKDGFLYQGYMSEISYKVEKPDGIKYELIVKAISRL